MQDAFAPTLGFSAIGVCAGQVEGGATTAGFLVHWVPKLFREPKNVKTVLPRDEWNAVLGSRMARFVLLLSSPRMILIT